MLPSQELLEELYARYILNVPQENLQSPERMMFVIEEAHWFYEDHYRELYPSLKQLSLKEFTKLVFEKCPGMESYKHLTDDIYKRFQAFKAVVPVFGAILLDPTHTYVLLVKGQKSNAAWGFPRGKISKDEEPAACAIREVYEETGLDISGRLVEGDYIETAMGQQSIRLYIITGISMDTPFAARVKGEIGGYAWHEVKNLPATREEDATPQYTANDGGRYRFFMVWPFVKRLRNFIKRRRKAIQAGEGKPHQDPEQGVKVPTDGVSKKSRRGRKKSEAGGPFAQEALPMHVAAAPPKTSREEGCEAMEVAHTVPIACAMGPPASPWLSFQLDAAAVMRCLTQPQPAR